MAPREGRQCFRVRASEPRRGISCFPGGVCMPIQIGRAGSEKILSPREDGRAGAWDSTHEYRDAVAEQPKHIGSNLKMQGDFRKMQGGGHRNLAKSHQISIAWMASP